MDLAPANFMELPKYTYYLKIAQLIIFHYIQSVQILGLPDTI